MALEGVHPDASSAVSCMADGRTLRDCRALVRVLFPLSRHHANATHSVRGRVDLRLWQHPSVFGRALLLPQSFRSGQRTPHSHDTPRAVWRCNLVSDARAFSDHRDVCRPRRHRGHAGLSRRGQGRTRGASRRLPDHPGPNLVDVAIPGVQLSLRGRLPAPASFRSGEPVRLGPRRHRGRRALLVARRRPRRGFYGGVVAGQRPIPHGLLRAALSLAESAAIRWFQYVCRNRIAGRRRRERLDGLRHRAARPAHQHVGRGALARDRGPPAADRRRAAQRPHGGVGRALARAARRPLVPGLGRRRVLQPRQRLRHARPRGADGRHQRRAARAVADRRAARDHARPVALPRRRAARRDRRVAVGRRQRVCLAEAADAAARGLSPRPSARSPRWSPTGTA